VSDILDAAIRRTVELVKSANPDLVTEPAQFKEALNGALESIQLKMGMAGLVKLRQEANVLAIPANTLLFNTTSTPSIPSMYTPIRVWERVTGTTTWVNMQKVIDHLPVNATQSSYFIWWNWRNETLETVGSTSIEDLKIHYTPRATDFAMPQDPFGFPDLLGPCAFLAASTILGGNPYYESRCADDLHAISSIDSQLQQSTPVRLKRRRAGVRRF
jgi:hypothetical protein